MTLTITRYQQAAEALRQRDLRQALYDEGSVVMNQVLVNLHGDQHKVRRQVEQQVFRRDYFRYYEQQVFPRTLDETIAPYLTAGRMDIVDFGYRVLVNLTADFTGIDRPERSPEETATFIDMLRLFARTALLAHYTEDRDAVRREAEAGLERFNRRFVAPSVARRRALLQAGTDEADLPRDILMVLLLGADRLALPDDVLVREMAFFALAGAHTSIHTLAHVMHEIFTWRAAHPEDAQRLLRDPLFVQRCVHESVRLHPSSPVAMRRALCPVHMAAGDADTDTPVTISLEAANRDVEVFGADAAQFNPHRELPKGVPPYGLSFGLGMHACLGLNLAAGVLPRLQQDSTGHHLGTVAQIVDVLLQRGIRPDPHGTPAKDATTARDIWATYPALLETDG